VFDNIARDRLEDFLKELGARVTSAVSGKTDYLIGKSTFLRFLTDP